MKRFIESDEVSIDELTVIVPFRNERERIAVLLTSIKESSVLPAEFLFVDDHSTDNTAELIVDQLAGIPFKLIQLNETLTGKKPAIREAMKLVRTKWVLSMDADVHFSSEYFEELNRLIAADATILPVVMESKKWYHRIFELDVLLINAINAGINGWKRPIIASVANLLYKKSAFELHDRYELHQHMPSGDDIYLLRDLRNGHARVTLTTNPNLSVVTETPQSLKEFIHQRLRWIAKTGDVGDHLSTVLSVVQAFFTFFFFGLIVYSSIQKEVELSLIVYSLKTVIDLVVFFPFFYRMNRLKSWFFIPIYEFFFPIYSLFIVILMYTYKPVWKGRRLTRNY